MILFFRYYKISNREISSVKEEFRMDSNWKGGVFYFVYGYIRIVVLVDMKVKGK